ncbi:MAG TPA: 23S rRNA (pseudouridine(1915)-N(3))-methyltransferase RlmH [Thermoanaerobaculia bacterium]|nr:23S rRNA (pseudouridine(1915)-N(3))-methyltransferase RlmH [Thermoanaerobaculia bacterium]
MGREIVIAWAGRHRRDSWETLCAGYRRKIERFLPIHDLPLRVPERGSERDRLKAEAEALLAALPERRWLVALDEKGKARSSRDLARWWRKLAQRWPHPVAFVLGSDLGLDPGLVAAADERLSLGPMTLPHELARLLIYEQIYRALSIGAGIKYHRGPL